MKESSEFTLPIKGFTSLLLKVAAIFIVGLLLLILSLQFMVHWGIFGPLPDETELRQLKNNQASDIISVDNRLLGRYYYENRTNASLDEIPVSFLHALIATEDVRFYKHKGVDFRSSMRVLIKSVILGNKSAGGGSTLSQQLAKNLFPRKQYRLFNMPIAKIKEIKIALRLENIYTKDEILSLYLNTVSFGENTYGIETASLVYFSKKPAELNVQEGALLVGLLKANTIYNPRLHREAALKRRNTVLAQMKKHRFLTKEAADSILDLPLELRYRPFNHTEGPAPYFREQLRQELGEILKDAKKADGTPYNLYADGLNIYTTVNYTMQLLAEEAVSLHLASLQTRFDAHWKNKEPWKKNPEMARRQIEQSQTYKSLRREGLSHNEALAAMKTPVAMKVYGPKGEHDTLFSPLDSVLHHFKTLQAGVLVMNPFNGDVLVWVGGAGYKFFKFDHVKAKRQAGSTFKPIVYAAAIEKGISPCDYFANDSVAYPDYQNWVPQNADLKYGGFYSMKGALAQSVNTVSARIITKVGIQETIELAHKMGISSDLPAVPSLALGAGEVSLYEMVQAYCVFANNGRTVAPRLIRRIENSQGQVIYSDPSHELQDSVLSAKSAQTMLAMLKGTVERGTAQSLRTQYGITSELAGKTGTTQNHSDGWFMCLAPNLVMGVWVGADNPAVSFRNLSYGQGSAMALPISALFLTKLYADPLYKYLKTSSFKIDPAISELLNCSDYLEEYNKPFIDASRIKEEGVGEFIRKVFGRKKNQSEVDKE